MVLGSLVERLFEAEANWRCNAHKRAKRVDTLAPASNERKLQLKARDVRRFERRSVDHLARLRVNRERCRVLS